MEFTDQDYELLSTYLDGDLNAGERAALEARLVAEPALQRELAALRQTVQLVNSLPQLKAPHDFVLTPAMVSNKVIQFPAQQRSRLLKFVLPVLSVAASVLIVLVGLSMLLSSQMSSRSPVTGSTASQTDVAAASSPTAMLTLDATLTTDGVPLDAMLLATEDVDEEAATEADDFQSETDDSTALLMVAPSESPLAEDGDVSSGGAAMDSAAEPAETLPLITASPLAQGTVLADSTRQSSQLPATSLYYESAPSVVGTQGLTNIAPPVSSGGFSMQTTTDAITLESLNEAETQAKLLTETPVSQELSSAAAVEEDIAPAGDARMDRSVTGIELFAVDLSIWITIVITLIRSLS